MRGLKRVPDINAFKRARSDLQKVVSERRLVQIAMWARLDARLGEILVAHLRRNWLQYHPLALNRELLRGAVPWPAAFGVLLEMCALAMGREYPGTPTFLAWRDLVMSGVSPSQGELFFVGLYKLGSKFAVRQAEGASQPYLRWGYLGQDLWLNKASSQDHGTVLAASRRQQVLNRLIESQPSFTVADYRAALGGTVSARQAQRDLARHPQLKAQGFTRNRIYRVKASRVKAGLG